MEAVSCVQHFVREQHVVSHMHEKREGIYIYTDMRASNSKRLVIPAGSFKVLCSAMRWVVFFFSLCTFPEGHSKQVQ